ncbi:MAG: hypothetical protein CMC96_05760 [Flavobacteriales bacterium]|nr:hypothetical protein [Flavobacteriales bacterium]
MAEFNYSLAVSKKFANFFSSYTQAFNKVHQRKGTLFMKPFKRKRISDEKYLRKLIHYIHYNPVESGLVEKVQDWKYSSYQALVSVSETKLDRDEVLQIFENKSNFIFCHQTPPSMSGIEV